MSSRILMATVAAIALAVPAAAQDQKQPLETQQETTQEAPASLQEQGAEGAAPTAEGQPAQPPATAEEEPAEQPPATAQEEPAEEAAEEEVAEEEQAPPADNSFFERPMPLPSSRPPRNTVAVNSFS